MDKEESFSSYLYLTIIFIATIVFYPIGIFLILQLIKKDREMISSAIKIMRLISFLLIVGVILMIFKMVFIRFGVSEISLAIFWLSAGLYVKGFNNSIEHDYVLEEKFIDMIVNQKGRSLDKMAEIVGVTTQEATTKIKSMINKGLLPYGDIDYETMNLIFEKEIICPNCGAKQVVKMGSGQACEFCETILY